jgi:ribonuclease-3
MKFLRTFRALFGGRSSGVQEKRVRGEIDFQKLAAALRFQITRKDLFAEALAHRSWLQFQDDQSTMSNERLEFLGDAVLSLVMAEFLFHTHPGAQEGTLTKLRSRLVNHKALTVYARQIRLSEFVLLSSSAAQMEGKGMDTILADAFEALIGAIYLDGGYVQAKQFVERNVRLALDSGTLHVEDKNFKSQLLELTQPGGLGTPRYVTVRQHGPDHDRTFTVEVFLGGTAYGVGVGKNKKDAEQQAAEHALRRVQSELSSAGDPQEPRPRGS